MMMLTVINDRRTIDKMIVSTIIPNIIMVIKIAMVLLFEVYYDNDMWIALQR